jgi:hypothetical protein
MKWWASRGPRQAVKHVRGSKQYEALVRLVEARLAIPLPIDHDPPHPERADGERHRVRPRARGCRADLRRQDGAAPRSRKLSWITLRVLVGEYRRPFLLRRAFLKESDLKALLAGRRDIKETVLSVR